jgi:hypothetical protein
MCSPFQCAGNGIATMLKPATNVGRCDRVERLFERRE